VFTLFDSSPVYSGSFPTSAGGRRRVNRRFGVIPECILAKSAVAATYREFSAELRVLSASLASRDGWLILGELAIKGAWGGSWLACRLKWPGDHI